MEECQHVVSSQLPDRSGGCFMLLPSPSDDGGPDLLLLPALPQSLSTGYFIHDFLDMALNQPFKQSWELLLHHSLVISCFGLAVTSRLYLGFAAVSLLVEINSVFLHLRQLLILSGRRNKPGTELTAPQPSLAYSITSWLNVGTFLVFRACTLGWMSRWLARHSEHIPRYVLMMGAAGLSERGDVL
uniref:TLC domain-containing protein n=1 Tax=Astatotilapia calliptera TaxID=8154 RepID=A0A3P8P1D7_ASTCA